MRDRYNVERNKSARFILLLSLLFFFGNNSTIIASPLPSSALIDNAYLQGAITRDKANLYKAYLAFSPERLPKEFQSDAPEKCGTSARKQALQYLFTLDAAAKKRYKLPLNAALPYDNLDAPSTVGLDKSYETQHFIIWYTKSGNNAPPLTDANANTLPDYIESAGTYAEQVYDHEINVLGNPIPPINTIPKLYIYVMNIGSGIYGVTYYGYFPGNSGNQLDVLYAISNSFSFARANDDPDGTVLGAMKVTIAHEFYHGVQAHDNWFLDVNDGYWFAEASAVWMEDEAYPNVNDYIGYLPAWFASYNVPLNYTVNLHQYGDVIFAKFLTEHVAKAPDIIKQIWAESANIAGGGGRSLDVIPTVLTAKYQTTLPDVIRDFYVANYLKDYQDGVKFPDVKTTDYSSVNVNLSQNSLIHLSALYYSYQSSTKKPLALQFDGSDDGTWSFVLVKEAGTTKTQENIALSSAKKDGYSLINNFGETYTKVVAVLVNGASNNSAKYDYQSAVGGFGTNPALTPPSNLSVTYSAGKTTLTWTAGGGALAGYKIYRSATQGSGYSLLATIGAQTSYDDTSLAGGKLLGQTTFYYLVTSYDANGESFASKEATVVVTSSALASTYAAPNPAKTKITIYATFAGDAPVSASIELYNLSGKRIQTFSISSPPVDVKKRNPFAYTLDGLDIPSGVYVYRLSFISVDGTKTSSVGKFAVVRQ